jgi:hypothetical protein
VAKFDEGPLCQRAFRFLETAIIASSRQRHTETLCESAGDPSDGKPFETTLI